MLKVNMESETKEYTFLELIDLFNLKKLKPESINEIFDIHENKLNYFILKLFDYNIEEEVENSIMDILEAMKQRHSVRSYQRSYQNKPLEDTVADQLEHFIVHLQFTVEKNWLL